MRDGAAGPGSVVLKVAASDPGSRQTGLALGLYEREVRFYTDVAPRIAGPVAPCYHAGFDAETGVFHLLLGDAGPAVVGDEIRGATIEQAMLAMTELGRLHAQLLGDAAMADVEWLNRGAPMNQALIAQLYAGSPSATATTSLPRIARCASGWSPVSTHTSLQRRLRIAFTAWCTATTGWTTCCSGSRVPTGRSQWSTGRPSPGGRR